MKKKIYILSILAILLGSLYSCDITRKPKATPEQRPFETMLDVQMNRDALYALLRNTESPNTLNGPDFMSDLYVPLKNDGNSTSPLYKWSRQGIADHDIVTNFYFLNYYSLMQANYFIMRAEEYLKNDNLVKSEDEKKLIGQYIGEAKIIRALAHWRVVQRFALPWCNKDFDVDDATKGIILVEEYNPFKIAKSKKSSRKAVYESIYRDLDDAIKSIPADANKDVKPAIYLTQDYAYAVKARAALTREDWETAMECAKKVMDNYPLSSPEEISRLWVTEDSPEILVRLYTTKSLGAIKVSLYGGRYRDDLLENGKKIRRIIHFPQMLLSNYVVKLYSPDDARRHAFVDDDFFGLLPWPSYESRYIGSKPLEFQEYVSLAKFRGNPSLTKDPKAPEFKVGIHLFNVGEAYLIYSEAAYRAGEFDEAYYYIKKLREARGLKTHPTYSELNFEGELANERIRELIGEGFRMNDLVRWNKGITRDASKALQPAEAIGIFADISATNLKIGVDDDRFDMMIWEFPTRDINQNADLSKNRNWK